MPRYPAGELRGWVARLFEAAGLDAEDARLISDVLVSADRAGVHSHGVVRVGAYAELVRSGIWRSGVRPRLVREGAAFLLLDAEGCPGPVAAVDGMTRCVEKARRSGLAGVWVRSGGHFGRAGYYAEIAAREGLVGVAMANAAPSLAPWGGRERTLGNNPVAVAVPRRDGPPIVLDMALSVAAQGRVRLAAERRERLPAGWALDPHGHPTDDPQQALAGTLLPVGGYKGYGMALVVDVLTGVLCGGSFGRDVSPLRGSRYGASHAFFAVDVRHLRGPSEFFTDVERLVHMVKGTALAPGYTEVLLPGEREARCTAEQTDAVELPEEVVAQVRRVAALLGLPGPREEG
ncbi:MAG: Ldh family oxidoreductase [Armatimonadota bacterium]|nr:Ldh family oxidoreductase [Armatimonadota bacterium]MDR5675826.1 Ldh family oxidoreductase [Armatimonadota bacterium]MDR5689652.1 Ldh family oxidoreductase [Armatimonadota bacterium]MDR7387066.1 Ldh family oxidoreductase [Armatimonadota bacterium]MDR7389488.1 Ldh family oxidoreductase [Armatimonadota bacterium]